VAVLAITPFINAAPPGVTGFAPDFAVTTTTGGTYTLSSDLGVRPLMVEFMHPDCSHCRNMGPTLQAAHDDYGSRVRFVTVAIRLPGFSDPTTSTVSTFALTYGHDWTYGVDRGTAARDAYGIGGTPTFVFIRQNGTIAETRAGELSLSELEAALAAIAGA
jgi:thiol-disulfide isomerase/thioredoxin